MPHSTGMRLHASLRSAVSKELIVNMKLMNHIELHPNFERLVLGCIDADFLKVHVLSICWYKDLVGKLLMRSSRFNYVCTDQTSTSPRARLAMRLLLSSYTAEVYA